MYQYIEQYYKQCVHCIVAKAPLIMGGHRVMELISIKAIQSGSNGLNSIKAIH